LWFVEPRFLGRITLSSGHAMMHKANKDNALFNYSDAFEQV
jgi:hypothetical protein